MKDPYLLVFYVLLVVIRVVRMKTLFALPTTRGEGWFFSADLRAEPIERGNLVRQYRAWLAFAWLTVEVIALADVLVYGEYDHLLWVQAPITLLLGGARRVIVRYFALRSQDLVPRQGSARQSLSLRPRRLAAYTNIAFEIVNGLVVLASIVVLVDQATAEHVFPVLAILYVEVGILMRKVLVLRTPVALPAQRSEEYLALTDDAFRASMNILDAVRGWLTFALVLVAVKASWTQSEFFHSTLFTSLLVGIVVVFTIAVMIYQLRVQRSLLARAKSVPTPLPRPPLPDPENLALGGLVYKNADNPAVIVDGGPLRFAVNVANKVTYVYLAYWIGLAALIAAVTLHGANR